VIRAVNGSVPTNAPDARARALSAVIAGDSCRAGGDGTGGNFSCGQPTEPLGAADGPQRFDKGSIEPKT